MALVRELAETRGAHLMPSRSRPAALSASSGKAEWGFASVQQRDYSLSPWSAAKRGEG